MPATRKACVANGSQPQKVLKPTVHTQSLDHVCRIRAASPDEDELEQMRISESIPTPRDIAPNPLAWDRDLIHSRDEGYDAFYPCKGKLTEVFDHESRICVKSPREALGYCKSNSKKIRRRIRHITFTEEAMLSNRTPNGAYWNGLFKYMRTHLCIETIDIPAPFCELSELEFASDLDMIDLWDFRSAYDKQVYDLLGYALFHGSLKELKLRFSHPHQDAKRWADFGPVSSIKAAVTQATLDDQEKGVSQGRTSALVRARIAQPHWSTNENMTLEVMKLNRTVHPRASLLGLPREIRDNILRLAYPKSRSFDQKEFNRSVHSAILL